MVSAFVLGLVSVYLAIKYGLLTGEKRSVLSAGLVGGPSLVALLVRLALLAAPRPYDVGLTLVAALPLLWPALAHPLLGAVAAVLGGITAVTQGERTGVGPSLFACAAIGAVVVLARARR